MRLRQPGKADLLFLVAIIGAFVIVFWALFGSVILRALGGA